ncbi:MAG: hypothetical protein ABIG30_02845, partial [Candidatus Aenigmatarchaeota archaeon]
AKFFKILKPPERWEEHEDPVVFFKVTTYHDKPAVFSLKFSVYGQRDSLMVLRASFDGRDYTVDSSSLNIDSPSPDKMPEIIVTDHTVQPPARHLMDESDFEILRGALTEQMTYFEYASVFGTPLAIHSSKRLELKGRARDDMNEFFSKAFPHAAPKQNQHG